MNKLWVLFALCLAGCRAGGKHEVAGRSYEELRRKYSAIDVSDNGKLPLPVALLFLPLGLSTAALSAYPLFSYPSPHEEHSATWPSAIMCMPLCRQSRVLQLPPLPRARHTHLLPRVSALLVQRRAPHAYLHASRQGLWDRGALFCRPIRARIPRYPPPAAARATHFPRHTLPYRNACPSLTRTHHSSHLCSPPTHTVVSLP
jgi:hypothetical protein